MNQPTAAQPLSIGDQVRPSEKGRAVFGTYLKPGAVLDIYIPRGWTAWMVNVRLPTGAVTCCRAENYEREAR